MRSVKLQVDMVGDDEEADYRLSVDRKAMRMEDIYTPIYYIGRWSD